MCSYISIDARAGPAITASTLPVEVKIEDWRTRSKQIMILSESGKPIYCRCGEGGGGY